MSEYLNIGLDITDLLDNSPTHGKGPALIMCRGIEYMPVRRGHWQCEEVPCIYGKKFILTCSECGESVSVTESALTEEHYCRSCGARMNEEDQGDKEYEDSILAAQKSEE